MKQLHVLVMATTILLATGCKIRIEVADGGRVMSQSGVYECSANQSCDIDVVDVHFDEVFVAEPAAGFRFDGWQRRERGFCGESKHPCALSTAGFDEEEGLLRFLESPDEVFFLQPAFVPLAEDAFDLELFEDVTFSGVLGGFQVRYRFRGNGTYSIASPPLFAQGDWEFRQGNTVIYFSRLANTDSDDLTGYAVFNRFDLSDNAYIVCFIDDQSVKSVAAAVNICENNPNGSQSELLLYRIES